MRSFLLRVSTQAAYGFARPEFIDEILGLDSQLFFRCFSLCAPLGLGFEKDPTGFAPVGGYLDIQ
jgi:hypothetical protein